MWLQLITLPYALDCEYFNAVAFSWIQIGMNFEWRLNLPCFLKIALNNKIMEEHGQCESGPEFCVIIFVFH